MIALYHDPGSLHCLAVRTTLAEKRLAYESRPIELAAFEQHDPAFLAINPAGQVPVLEHDGHRLTESFFILLYLDERFPEPPLGGAEAAARYAVQRWGKYVETHLAPNLAVVTWSMRGSPPAPETRANFARLMPERQLLWQQACDGFAGVDAARTAVDKALMRIAEALQMTSWLTGDTFGLADIAVFPHVMRARAWGFALPAPVADWLERIMARPTVGQPLHDLRECVTMGPERGRWG